MIKMILTLCLLAAPVFCQEQTLRQSISSTAPNTARYEIVPTNHVGGQQKTFRLDKHTGRVYQLGTCPQKITIGTGFCWKEMTIMELPKVPNDGAVRYQMFIHAELRLILLMNLISGQTWQLGLDEPDRWSPILDTVVLPQPFEITR